MTEEKINTDITQETDDNRPITNKEIRQLMQDVHMLKARLVDDKRVNNMIDYYYMTQLGGVGNKLNRAGLVIVIPILSMMLSMFVLIIIEIMFGLPEDSLVYNTIAYLITVPSIIAIGFFILKLTNPEEAKQVINYFKWKKKK